MRVKCIESIKGYGIFRNYQNTNVKEFSNTNILFGWNYSGKTTLSRIFRSLEKKEAHKDFLNAKFKLKLDDGSQINELNITDHPLNIRVFNLDYIRDNLKWENSGESVEPILMVGEDNIKLREEISKLAVEENIISQDIKYKSNIKIEKSTARDTSLTDKARQITNELSLGRNFTKRSLEVLLNDNDINSWLLNNDDFTNSKTIALSTERKEELNEIDINVSYSFLDEANDILQKTVNPSQTISKLKNNSRLEDWIRDGISLHKDKTHCEFCGNELSKDYMDKLDAHFSKDYEEFRNEIIKLRDKLKNSKIKIDLKNKNNFYKSHEDKYLECKTILENEINYFCKLIDRVIQSLEAKLSNLFAPALLSDEINSNKIKLEIAIVNFNNVIKDNNETTRNFTNIQQENIEILKKYYAADFYINSSYQNNNEDIKLYDNSIETLSRELAEKQAQRLEKEKKVSELEIGAEALNYYIKLYFGQNTPISIKVTTDNKFLIYRNEVKATNLSEGEKTAISFSYFLTKLNDKNTKDFLNDIILYIDDPISSLDNNHLFNTYALISSCLKNNCAQLFISTHNFEFFNFLKDEFKPRWKLSCDFVNKSNHSCSSNLYSIERSIDNAIIKNIDCILCHYKSEYHFIFSQIVQIYEGDGLIDEYKIYTAPNLLRRFLETYLSFNHPSGKGLRENLKQLIRNDENLKLVYKIVDELSHNENIERSLKLYNVQEIKQAISIIFNSFESVRPDYFNELKTIVGFRAN